MGKKYFKKLITTFATISLLFSLCAFVNCNVNALSKKNYKVNSAVKKNTTTKNNYNDTSFACNTSSDESAFAGDGSLSDPYIISSSDDLKCLSFLSNIKGETISDKYSIEVYYKQTADIDLGGSETNQWIPISTTTDPEFQFYGGGYDGDGKKIENLYISTTDANATLSDKAFGLFGFVRSDVDFKNINFENININISSKQSSYVGSVAGKIEQYNDDNIDAKLTNIHIISGSFLNGDIVGGVVGFAENVKTIENCTNDINIFLNSELLQGGNNHFAGGLLGFLANVFELKNVSNSGTIENYHGNHTGGIIGAIDVGGYTGKEMYNTGTINGHGYVGGLFGEVANFDTLTDCYNSGNINNSITVVSSGPESSTGGIFGHLAEAYVEMHDLYNTGNISGGALAGGIGGWQEQSEFSVDIIIPKIYNLYNCGKVVGYERTGGLWGQLSASAFTLTDSYNVGDVFGGIIVGGIIGKTFGSGVTIKNIYNLGTVNTDATNPEGVGGIVGQGGNNIDWTAKTINSVLTLSKYVTSNNSNVTHRIYGDLKFSISDEGFYNNYSYIGVSNNNSTYSPYTAGTNDVKSPNGKNASCEDILSANFYKNTLGFNTDFWSITDNNLPILKDIPIEIQLVNMPSFFDGAKCSNTNFTLTVKNGVASQYKGNTGKRVTIKATVSNFDHWVILSGKGTVESVKASQTVFVFGDSNATIQAVEKPLPPKYSKFKQKGKKIIFYFKKGNVNQKIKIKYKKKVYTFTLKAGKTSYSIKVKSLNKKLKLKLKKGKKIKRKIYIYVGNTKYKKNISIKL